MDTDATQRVISALALDRLNLNVCAWYCTLWLYIINYNYSLAARKNDLFALPVLLESREQPLDLAIHC
jgi:hypothetical protein